MDRNEMLAKMRDTLERAGLPFEEIRVFGAIRCNVHVTCESQAIARKWQTLLNLTFPGSKAVAVQTAWQAKANKGTCLRPTMRRGYLVGIIDAGATQ